MATIYIQKLNIEAGLILLVLLGSAPMLGQSQKGKVLSSDNNSGIGFVNIGIIGKNVGTVSDEFGNFTLNIDSIYNNDSLRFSMIGYEPKSIIVSQFKEDLNKNVFLTPKSYNLPEIKVVYRKPRPITLGTPVFSNALRSGFESNDLGSELGVKLDIRGRVVLKDIYLNVAICTFDSVTYRLNIYELGDQNEYKNILTKPIYISFTKDKIKDVITFDLSKYTIITGGSVLVALELYKDLGEGRLLFHTEFFTGSTFHRKTSQGTWTEAAGVIGMYMHGRVIK